MSRSLQSRMHAKCVSLFEATDRICILIDLYKNKIASFRRGQAVKEKGSALYFSTLLTRFISFAHPSWILTPFHRTIRRPITTVQMLRKRVYCEISNELSYIDIVVSSAFLIGLQMYWLFHHSVELKKKKQKLENHLKRTDYPFAYKYFSPWEDSEHEILYKVSRIRLITTIIQWKICQNFYSTIGINFRLPLLCAQN